VDEDFIGINYGIHGIQNDSGSQTLVGKRTTRLVERMVKRIHAARWCCVVRGSSDYGGAQFLIVTTPID